MEGTFHRFTELPWELRDQIWNLAVRPSRPGVQIFKLYDPETEPYLNNAMNVSFDDYYRHNNYGIAIPDRNDNNSSAYLVDGGLWTVCKGSRRVMEHRSKSQRASRERINRMQPQNEPDALATGYSHDGNSHYFTVLPYQDLFLFQLEDPATIDWEQFPGEIPLGSSIWRFHGRLNIALEFKPEWGLQLGGHINKYERFPIVETFSRMVMALGASSYIWLVDYNIRRKQAVAGEESSTPNKEPTTFYARDRRLVEVVLEECEYVDEAEVREDASNEFFGDYYSSITFVDIVNSVTHDHWYSSHWHRRSWDTPHEYPCPIGLLSWDNLETKTALSLSISIGAENR